MRHAAILFVFAGISALAGPAVAQTFPPDADWVPFRCGTNIMTDRVRDQSGAIGERDIVGTTEAAAGFHAADAQFLYLRMRLDDDPTQAGNLRPFAWGFEFSIDGNASNYEILVSIDGATGVVGLYRNSTTTVPDSPEDPADTPAFASYPFASHGRTSQATSSLGGGSDFFIDVAVPWTDLAQVGLLPESQVVVWVASSTNPDRLNGDFACHDAGGITRVPSLSASASSTTRADSNGGAGGGAGTGATGGSGLAGAGGAGGAGGISLEGGPGCSLIPCPHRSAVTALIASVLLLGLGRRLHRARTRAR